jgi:hypothetical protein
VSDTERDLSQLRQEVDRYRQAAEMALEQLESCVDHLVDLQRDDLAQAMRRNRSEIRRSMSRPEP